MHEIYDGCEGFLVEDFFNFGREGTKIAKLRFYHLDVVILIVIPSFFWTKKIKITTVD